MQLAKRQTMWERAERPMMCAIFDGTDASSMTSTVSESMKSSTAGSISISFWANIHQIGQEPTFFSFLSINNAGITIAGCRDSKYCLFPVYQNIRVIPSNFYNALVYVPDEWHHFGICYDAIKYRTSLFIDGILKYSDTNSSGWFSSVNSKDMYVKLSGNINSDNRGFVGELSNVNFYRKAVSDYDFETLASDMNIIPTDADHQWLFENRDGTDTGIATTKFDLTVGSTTRFGTVEWGGGNLSVNSMEMPKTSSYENGEHLWKEAA